MKSKILIVGILLYFCSCKSKDEKELRKLHVNLEGKWQIITQNFSKATENKDFFEFVKCSNYNYNQVSPEQACPGHKIILGNDSFGLSYGYDLKKQVYIINRDNLNPSIVEFDFYNKISGEWKITNDGINLKGYKIPLPQDPKISYEFEAKKIK